jgi:DNA-binding beta-propeller fold protein YncE
MLRLLALLTLGLCLTPLARGEDQDNKLRRYLYVAQPGIRNYLQYGGHGVIVFDIDDHYKFVKRIPTGSLKDDGTPWNVKGVCGSAQTGRLYVSTIKHLICIDLHTDKVLWEKSYQLGCDRASISPDGKIIYQPSFEKDIWYALDGKTGQELARVTPKSRAHNTVYGNDGRFCYLAGLGSPLLTVANTSTHTIARKIGPFSQNIRPFTVNGAQTLCYVNINGLLGFEIGDLKTGKKLHRVEVRNFEKGKVKRHGCPSHGIALTPDESEVWVSDGHNEHLHLFDNTVMPPRQIASIKLREQPGWITFSIDGKTAWPSTGEIIDTKSRKIIATLTDEKGRMVMSEKVLEVDFRGKKLVAVGDQFGKGYKP